MPVIYGREDDRAGGDAASDGLRFDRHD